MEGSEPRDSVLSEPVPDSARLTALQRTGLLDSCEEEAFDRLTRLATKILRAPVALVSLVDRNRQFFKSQTGLLEPWASLRETPLSHSFCRHVVDSKAPLIISNALEDPRVSSNPAVYELGVAAYAGLPLTTADGQTLGSFCAIDSEPREWTEEEIGILRDLAASTVTEIELRTATGRAQREAQWAEEERKEKSLLLEALGQPVYRLDEEGRCTYINRVAAEALGYAPAELTGRVIHDLIHYRHSDGTPYKAEECPVLRTLETGKPHRGDAEPYWRKDGSSFPVEYVASPLLDGTGKRGVVISFSDITLRKQTEKRLAVQHAVSNVLASAADLSSAAQQLLTAIGQALDCQIGALWQLDPKDDVLRCYAVWSTTPDAFSRFCARTRALEISRGWGLPGRVWEEGTSIWSVDLAKEKNFLRSQDASEEGLRAALAFPILAAQFIGVMEFFTVRPQLPDEELQRTLSTLGRQIGQFVDRRQVETALRQSEARKAAVFQASLDCIVSIDQEGKVIDWNGAAEQTFGFSKDEVLGKVMAELIIPPSMREGHRRGMQHYRHTGEGPLLDRRIEVTALRANGTEFPVELTISPIHLDEGTMFTAYIRDISERRRSEHALLERTRLATFSAEVGLTITTENSLSAILQRCAELTVQYLDGAFARIWTVDDTESVLELQASAGLYTHLNGTHARVPVGRFKVGLIAQERRPHLTNDVADDPGISDKEWAAREGMVAFAGYPLVVEDRLMGVLAMFARSPQGEATLQALESVAHGIALVIQRKRVEDALKRAMEAAAVASEAKSLFLANMSHELRTPLNAVILYSELLQEEAQDRGDTHFLPDLEKIRAAGQHLLSLINNVLDLSKIEAGKMELYAETFEIYPMLQEVVSITRPLVEKKSNSLQVLCASEIGVMHADVTKVRQLLLNLLGNAAKFTEKGQVKIIVTREEVQGCSSVAFEVSDTGIGMTSEQVNHLFHAFSQADLSTTRRYGGTGLGLAISKRLAEMMGGGIEVRSVLGQGTSFLVRLPVSTRHSAVEPETPQGRKPETGSHAGTARVLVIDDDAGVRETMKRFLTKEGYEVHTAPDGEEGLRLARAIRPDIITLDAIMPRVDGWTVLQTLKANPDLSATPVIMLSVTEEKNLGYLMGVAEYMTKPLDRVRLATVLKTLLPGRKAGHVLIVEDEEITRKSLREVLEHEGWVVAEAADGVAGLRCLEQSRPDLILLDLLMPGMNGFEFSCELSKHAEWKAIPVIVITAKDLTSEDRSRLNGYVEKIFEKDPSTLEQLLHEVGRLLARPQNRPTNGQAT